MTQKPQSDDHKTTLIKRIYNTLLRCTINEKQGISNKQSDPDKMRKLFICALCTSCVGDMKNLYASFNSFLNLDFKDHDIIKKLVPIIEELDDIDRKEEDFKKERNSYLNEIDRNNYICETTSQYLEQVNFEYNDLNTDPQFKEINQLVTKTRKRSDKAERINQMIIHDMIYLVDRLNRQITMGKASK